MRHRCKDCGFEFNSYPQHPPNNVKTPQCPVCFKDNCIDIPPTFVQQSLSGSEPKGSSPKSCSTCFGTGKQIHISSHDCLNCEGTGEVEHDF